MTTNAGPANGNSSVPAPSATKPLGPHAAAAEKSGGFLDQKASGRLPYTGLPIWIVMLVASATLTAGWGIRRLVA